MEGESYMSAMGHAWGMTIWVVIITFEELEVWIENFIQNIWFQLYLSFLISGFLGLAGKLIIWPLYSSFKSRNFT